MPPTGWSIVFSDLDTIWVRAGLPAASQAGYDFELVQRESGGSAEQGSGSSINKKLADAVSAQIVPSHAGTAEHPDMWRLVLQPRDGSASIHEIAVDATLIVLLGWLAALGMRDAGRHMSQLRTALAVARRRLRQTHEHLNQEIELRARAAIELLSTCISMHSSTGLPIGVLFGSNSTAPCAGCALAPVGRWACC